LQEVFDPWSPDLSQSIGGIGMSRVIPAIGLLVSLYLLFLTLTPRKFRSRQYPKWPGALFTAIWWLMVTSAMPPLVGQMVTYDLIYGSLAGIMLVLFFFWLVGLGLVMGVELNAALAQTPEESERLGRAKGKETDEEDAE